MENKKLVTFAVPCYNSENFMSNCIESLLTAGEDTEIIIINDGSKDKTGEIADSYAEKYPEIVRVRHQENGGHGEGVNQGLKLAQGKYYKVVDSDDMLDKDELQKFMKNIRELDKNGTEIDMFVCNYVYVRCDSSWRRVMDYKNIFPEKKVCTWDQTRRFGASQYLMMHSVFYRTQLLRDCGIEMPKNTFYVDNLYMYQPFPYVNSIYYMNLNLYLYSVGSEEQSVSEKNMIKRIDQQILVAKLMIDCHDLNKIKSKKLYNYMIHELSIIISICDVFLEIEGSPESIEKYHELWHYIKSKDKRTYNKIRHISVASLTKLPGKAGRKLTVVMYRLVHRIYNVN